MYIHCHRKTSLTSGASGDVHGMQNYCIELTCTVASMDKLQTEP